MSYTLKPGVFGTPKPQLAIALAIAADVYAGWQRALVVTSLADGAHMPGSLHGRGYAADLRTSHLGTYTECVFRQLHNSAAGPPTR